jgi:hypothetical protein
MGQGNHLRGLRDLGARKPAGQVGFAQYVNLIVE